MSRTGLAMLTVWLVSACAATGDERSVTVEHGVNQFGVAETRAERHCAEFGRKALHVQTRPKESGFLGLQTTVSVFECIPP
jgi:hypothetical protein